jgi:hypothetical protein
MNSNFKQRAGSKLAELRLINGPLISLFNIVLASPLPDDVQVREKLSLFNGLRRSHNVRYISHLRVGGD